MVGKSLGPPILGFQLLFQLFSQLFLSTVLAREREEIYNRRKRKEIEIE